VTIALDGVESILQFVSMDIDMLKLSTCSLFEITKDNDADQPVILVGNKSDLVRKRSISRDGKLHKLIILKK